MHLDREMKPECAVTRAGAGRWMAMGALMRAHRPANTSGLEQCRWLDVIIMWQPGYMWI